MQPEKEKLSWLTRQTITTPFNIYNRRQHVILMVVISPGPGPTGKHFYYINSIFIESLSIISRALKDENRKI